MFWAVILLLAGLGAVALELFIPSAGIIGIISACLIVAGIVVGFLDSLTTGALMLLLSLIHI